MTIFREVFIRNNIVCSSVQVDELRKNKLKNRCIVSKRNSTNRINKNPITISSSAAIVIRKRT
jgi:hypothetical protein